MTDPPQDSSDPQTLLRQALRLVGTDPAQAEALARRLLAARPDDPEGGAVLSAALRAQGDPAAARGVIEPLAAHGASWIVQFEWARVLVALGRSRDAVAPLERVATLNPGLGGVWRQLGDIRLMSGDVRDAQAAYDRMLAVVVPDARLKGPAEALAEGRPEAAEAELRAFLARDPDSLPAAHLMAEALARLGQAQGAERLLEHCVGRAPRLMLARQAYALVLQRNGKLREALAQLDAVLARDPGDVRSRAAKADVLNDIGDHAAVAEIIDQLCAEFPDQAHAWVIKGAGLRTLGRIPEAIEAWRAAIALDPGRGDAYWSLADLKAFRFSGAELAAMESLVAAPDTPPETRSLVGFALGKASEDEGRFEDAFDHYVRANAIQRRRRGYSADQTTDLATRAKALFTPEFFAARSGWGDPAPAPIFVVGLPRSGSTLVEQILASHPDVESTAELMDIQSMARWVETLAPDPRGPAGYPDRLAALPREVIRQLGVDYLARTGPRRRLGRARFIDKAPWNWLHAGFIQLILPGAKIVDIRRHPLGCCLSAYKQHFVSGFDFAFDLADLGRYYADYVDLMAHFDAATPGRVHRVIYEALVADTEVQVRRLLASLELPFDPACLRFFENSRPVATPSSEQVRQPIFTDAVAQWRNFEPWLGPLKDALGPVLDSWSGSSSPSSLPPLGGSGPSDLFRGAEGGHRRRPPHRLRQSPP
ncbi:MAG TPA: sulfotransferase [Caulobacteraceae bacterium]|nr:sulfotransferase [Caulobacteraceae bacterium]